MHAAKKRPKSLRPGRGQNVHGQAVAAMQIVPEFGLKDRNLGVNATNLGTFSKVFVYRTVILKPVLGPFSRPSYDFLTKR